MKKEIEPAYPVLTTPSGKFYQKPGMSIRQKIASEQLGAIMSGYLFNPIKQITDLNGNTYTDQMFVMRALALTDELLIQEEKTR